MKTRHEEIVLHENPLTSFFLFASFVMHSAAQRISAVNPLPIYNIVIQLSKFISCVLVLETNLRKDLQ